jgi:hypothetical protein
MSAKASGFAPSGIPGRSTCWVCQRWGEKVTPLWWRKGVSILLFRADYDGIRKSDGEEILFL